jgi:antitoxin MazE6
MKAAISVPDHLFEEADRVARRLRVPRSRIYSLAIEEFVKKHRQQSLREALEAVYGGAPVGLDPLLTDLQARALREKW